MSIVTLNKNNFEKEVLNSSTPVLVDFWASWCGPCRMLSPTVEEIANEKQDIKIGKVNIDDEGQLAQAFGIMSIPTLIVFKEGEAVKRSVGVIPKSEILAML